MIEKQGSIWKTAISAGLVVGGVSLLLSLVGMVAAFNGRYIITGLVTMGQLLLFIPLIAGGYSTITKSQEKSLVNGLLGGALSGVFSGLVLALLLLIGSQIDLRAMFPNASPELYGIISFGMSRPGVIAKPDPVCSADWCTVGCCSRFVPRHVCLNSGI
jgi:hypothetical protein